MSGICIIGLGSLHGDDQLGWELVRLLESEAVTDGVDSSLRLFACRSVGGAVLETWKDTELAIIIDAIRSGATPGTILRIALHPQQDPSELDIVRTLSSHGIDLHELIEIAIAIDELPPRVLFYGVEMDACTPFGSMSPTVCAVLPDLARAVHAEIFAACTPA